MALHAKKYQSRLEDGDRSPKGVIALLAIAMACLFICVPLRAQSVLAKYQELKPAADYFFDDQFQQTIAAMQKILEGATLDRQGKIVALQFLAFSYYSLEDGKARPLIRQILELDVRSQADPNLFWQDYTKFFNFEKTQNLRQVRLNSDPRGARLYVKDRLLGVAPIDTVLLSGEYNVRVEKENYRAAQETYVIEGGQEIFDRVLKLERAKSKLRWYTGGVLVTGGAVYLLVNNKEKTKELPELPGPPRTP